MKDKNLHYFFINCAFQDFLYICLWFNFNFLKYGNIEHKPTN